MQQKNPCGALAFYILVESALNCKLFKQVHERARVQLQRCSSGGNRFHWTIKYQQLLIF